MKQYVLIIIKISIILGLSNCSNAQENKKSKLSEAEKAKQVDSITRRAIERMIVEELDNTIFISVDKLHSEYLEDETSANKKYLNKTIIFESKITEFYTAENSNEKEKYAIALETNLSKQGVVCFYNDKEIKKHRKQGDIIKIKGKCSGLANGGIQLHECELYSGKKGNWNYIKEMTFLNPNNATIVYLSLINEDSKNTIKPIFIYSNKKYFCVPRYYSEALDSNNLINFDLTNVKNLGVGSENAEIYESFYENNLAEKYILPTVDSGSVFYEIINGKQCNSIKSVSLEGWGHSDWVTYCANFNSSANCLLYSNNNKIGLNYEKFIKVELPVLDKYWGEGDSEHRREYIGPIDIDNNNTPELIYEVSDYEEKHYEVWTSKNNKWENVFDSSMFFY